LDNQNLVSLLHDANKQIKTLDFNSVCNLINESKTIIIDVREESEVQYSGLIKNAIHIPRGVIEFKLKLDSMDNPVDIDDQTNILIYCAAGYRSVLAAKTLNDMGFKNVFNMPGFADWVTNGGEIESLS